MDRIVVGPRDYYRVLGVAQTASSKEVKLAYRALCREFHPELRATPEATGRMQEINEAYQHLSSASKRAEYDRWLELRAGAGKSTAADQSVDPSSTTNVCCDKCGATDASVRLSVFTWVVSLIVVSYKRGWARILCRRCRVKCSLLFNLEVLSFGWLGIPYGFLWSLEALWWNAQGGKQGREHNATILAAIGHQRYAKGDFQEAAQAWTASLRLRHDPQLEAFLRKVMCRTTNRIPH